MKEMDVRYLTMLTWLRSPHGSGWSRRAGTEARRIDKVAGVQVQDEVIAPR
jgi:hypothetical protein